MFIITETLVQGLKQFAYILFTFNISVGLVQQLQSFLENLTSFLDHILLQSRVEEELLQNSNRGQRILSEAKGNQEMFLHFLKDFEPWVEILFSEFHTHSSVKDFNMRPLQVV